MYTQQLAAMAAAGQTRAEVVEGPGGTPVEIQVPIDPNLPEAVVASMIAEQLQRAIGQQVAAAQGGGDNVMARLLRSGHGGGAPARFTKTHKASDGGYARPSGGGAVDGAHD